MVHGATPAKLRRLGEAAGLTLIPWQHPELGRQQQPASSAPPDPPKTRTTAVIRKHLPATSVVTPSVSINLGNHGRWNHSSTACRLIAFRGSPLLLGLERPRSPFADGKSTSGSHPALLQFPLTPASAR